MSGPLPQLATYSDLADFSRLAIDLDDMDNAQTSQLVTQLIALHARSLPVYLADAAPFAATKHEHAKDVVNMIAADQMMTVDKLADYKVERNQAVSTGYFPIEFTGFHDLSINYLLSELVRRQESEISTIDAICDKLKDAPSIRPLAEESLGAAKGHLESLQELLRSVTA